MASLVLGVVGGAVGYMVGGPAGAQVGFALGSAAGGLLFPPKGPDGPRLGDLNIQGSAYGQPIPIPYGTDRVAGNVIWADKIQEHAEDQGGKGGPTYTTYSYTCSLAVGIVEGPIAGILRIWADGLLIYDRRPTHTGATVGFKAGSHKIYLGTEDQLPDPTIQAIQVDTPAYRGLAYIVFTDLHLGKFGNRIPSLTFEYVTNGAESVAQTTTYGQEFVLASHDPLFGSDMDTNGHLWVSTMSGHGVLDAATGKWTIDPAYSHPQIQEYDPITKELLWAYDVPPIVENWDATTHVTIYPIAGASVAANGYYFVGRGSSGWPYTEQYVSAYVHGVAVNIATHEVSYLTDTCSHSQFNNAFYWPSVPVPVIDNNKVYMAAGNGVDRGLGIGFMPASIQGSPDTDPTPNRSGEQPLWSAPVGWAQARVKHAPCPLPPNNQFDGTALNLTHWAIKSTVIANPSAVIVQGWTSEREGSYLTWVGNSYQVSAFDLGAADDVSSVVLPGSQVVMPPIAWDEKNATLWAFAGDAGNYNTLYAITHAGIGGLTLTGAGFSFPDMQGADVKGMTIDKATGYLRLVVGGGSALAPTTLMLFDPMTQTVVDSSPITLPVEMTYGRMFDLPDQGRVVFANGYKIYDIPYGAPLNGNPVNLGAIVANVSKRAGLALADIDVTELTDMVDGYTITRQMAARSAIEPLMQAYFFDPVESDYQIKFRKRGRQPMVTIPDDDLAAHAAGSEVPDLVQVKRKQELDLPQTVSVKYKSIAADYQTGTQYERRMAGRSQSDVTVDIPIAMGDDKAKQIAAAALYSAWAERTGLSFSTSLKYAALEPTDTAIVHNRLVRIVHRKRNGGILEWEAYADGNTIFPSDATTQGSTSAPSAPVGQVITTTPPTQLVAIDAPVTMEGTTTPSLTFAVQGTATGFAGAQIWKSIDGGVSYQPIASAPNASLIGTTQNVLGDYQGGDTFDEINTVRVTLLPSSTGATLSSATELAVLNGANAAMVGNEVLQYKRATLNDDGSYTLSGLLRYRRGTDYATHMAGETFVPLTGNLVQIPVSTSEIGIPRQYKAVSNGGTLAEAQAVTLTYSGADLKPYSPAHIGGWRDGDGNLTLSWTRRTRVDGSWRDGVDVPLGEASEAYDVEITDSTGTAVKRTFSGITSPTLIYTGAQQIADFGALQSTVYARVYQLSQLVGRGWPGIGSV